MSDSFATLWTVACQASLSMREERQAILQAGYWSGLPWPPLWDRPDPGIEPVSIVSPALAGGFPLAPSGKPPTNSQLLYKTSPKREFIKPTFKILAQRLHSLLRHPISMRSFIHSFDHSHSFKQILSTFSKPLQMLLYVELVFSFP